MNLNLNTKKTKSMVFLPGALHGHISNDAYDRRKLGQGDTFEARKRRRVRFT
jgi:hypothetical protein